MNAKTQGVGFHISPHDQIARICGANIRGCDYGISEDGHLNAEEANLHNAKIAQGANPTVQTLKKTPKSQKTPTSKTKEAYSTEVVNGMTAITFNKEKLTPEFAKDYAQSFMFDKYDEVQEIFEIEGLPLDENSYVLNNDLDQLKETYPESFTQIEKDISASNKSDKFLPAHYLTKLEDLIREEEQRQVFAFWKNQKPQNISESEIRNIINDKVYEDNPSKKYSFEQ